MNQLYKYSIIIPHYKIVELLKRALLSIPDREDIQIVVVDDNSGIEEDRFYALDFFKKAQCSFLFTKESGGAGYVRNVGLTKAEGQWLLFLDADDFFEQGAFELFDVYAQSENDIVYFNTRSVCSDTLMPSDRFGLYRSYIDFVNPLLEEHVNIIRCSHVVPIAKMIRRSLVENHHVLFDEIPWGNDVMFATRVGTLAHKVWVDKRVVYVVTERAGSLVKQVSVEALLGRYQVALRANDYLRKNGYAAYQNTILFHIKRIAPFGVRALLKALMIGVKFNAYNKQTLYRSSKITKHIIRSTQKA